MDFKLPDVGEGLVEGVLVKWHVEQGGSVAKDGVLCEIETDKAVVEIPSPVDGTIAELRWKEGDTVPVGDVLVVIDDGSGSSDSAEVPASSPAASPPPPSQPEIPPQVSTSEVAVSSGAPKELPLGFDRVLATPYTRRLARELGVDISQVTGTGPIGRVTEQDVQKFKDGGGSSIPSPAAAATAPAASPTAPQSSTSSSASTVESSAPQQCSTPDQAPRPGQRVPLTHLRKVIAEHLSMAMHTMAPATHMDSVDVTELVALRSSLKEKAKADGVKLTYLPFITKAVVAALRKFPQFNASLDEKTQELLLHADYNVGFAVDTPEGLMVPVVKQCDIKSMYEIAGELTLLAGLAQDRKLTPDQLNGGTFSITNIGSIGGEFFVPIVNYPQVSILGVCRMKDELVLVNGMPQTRKRLNLVLSYDHRVVDGADAARFMNEITTMLSDPGMLLVRG